jgi:hypothetical protein
VQLLHPLNVGKLVGSQEATPQLCVGVRRKRVRLHQVGDEAHCRLRQGVKAVEESALLGDVAQPERPLRAGEPRLWVRRPERGSLTALLFAGGASSCCSCSMLRVLS